MNQNIQLFQNICQDSSGVGKNYRKNLACFCHKYIFIKFFPTIVDIYLICSVKEVETQAFLGGIIMGFIYSKKNWNENFLQGPSTEYTAGKKIRPGSPPIATIFFY